MNSQDLRSLLTDRAGSVDAHRPDRVAEVHGRIRAARVRRTATIAGAAAVVAALGIAAATLPGGTTKTQEPIDRPTESISTLQPETAREVLDRVTSDDPRGVLDPGTYVVDVPDLRPHPILDLPRGFTFGTVQETAYVSRFAEPDCTLSALACRRTPDEPSGPGGRLKVGFWNGEKIRVHPNLCGRFEDFERPGPGLGDLAATLAALPGFRATDPAPVSLGGYDGLYVELATVDPSCPAFWLTDRTTGLADDPVAGHVERFWVLDVEGDRFVVEASHEPGATGAQIAELTRIVESVRFSDTE